MSKFLSLLILVLVFQSGATALAAELHDYTSDGCSLFPDGTLQERSLWCECCFNHDLAYWRGGSQQERKTADLALRSCVLESTKNNALADLMYRGQGWWQPGFSDLVSLGVRLEVRQRISPTHRRRTAAGCYQARCLPDHPP